MRFSTHISNNIGIRVLDGGYLVYKDGAAGELCQEEHACESIEKVLDVVERLLKSENSSKENSDE